MLLYWGRALWVALFLVKFNITSSFRNKKQVFPLRLGSNCGSLEGVEIAQEVAIMISSYTFISFHLDRHYVLAPLSTELNGIGWCGKCEGEEASEHFVVCLFLIVNLINYSF